MEKVREKLKEMMIENPDKVIDGIISEQCPNVIGIRGFVSLCGYDEDYTRVTCESCWEKALGIGDTNE